ncbi:1-deoxy-D-xylulose-5-phosphate synthase [Listeria costaricensis]|uniref:1-deoxy-D-xylulose-5-phosphate synthase n=1 Tax=Listeria costaricensis TaxID=2026604 RepID=UPI000C08C637|nr:1-deoxy-D-xylulose-5-phosphate synthase [Listeria costaricensis]
MSNTTETIILDQVHGPDDVKKLTISEMEQAAREIRELILFKDSQHGGHIGPNLGVVELTLAFHYVFDSPTDKIVWDVSHQAYPHKILTGRKSGFEDPAHFTDITGYTSQHESKHDFFTVGHTSTSISLAVGLAKARDLKNESGNVLALIGDGSMSGGLAFEGLNNGAELNSNLIVIFNDNEMSIDENFGGLYRTLAELRASKGTSENNLFKAMGFDYRYIEEGNDLQTMIDTFQNVKDIDHPIVLHVHTEKGHGFAKAVENKMLYHWRTPFDLETGEPINQTSGENYSDLIVDQLTKKIESDQLPIVTINAAIPGMFGLKRFQAAHPDRYFDVGIAEGHSITFASALASAGIRPVVFHSSTFLQRAYDQLSHDLAINDNPAVLIIRGGSISGGAVTHQGLYDIPILSSIPNIVYLAPATSEQLTAMLDWALTQKDHPVAIRIPEHGVTHGAPTSRDYSKPHYEVTHLGDTVAILALGGFFQLGQEVHQKLAASGINATLINPQFITAYDQVTLERLKANHQLVLTLEDGSLSGGFGEKIAHYYGDSSIKVKSFGAAKEFTDEIPQAELYERYGLSAENIASTALDLIKK